VKKLEDKVNAPGDTPEARLGTVEDRVDEVALHGVYLGTTLGLVTMVMHTGVDYSTQPLVSMAARRRTSMTSRSSWSVSVATATPLPTPFISSLC
jgi:hypothetical protein